MVKESIEATLKGIICKYSREDGNEKRELV